MQSINFRTLGPPLEIFNHIICVIEGPWSAQPYVIEEKTREWLNQIKVSI